MTKNSIMKQNKNQLKEKDKRDKILLLIYLR